MICGQICGKEPAAIRTMWMAQVLAARCGDKKFSPPSIFYQKY